MTFYSFAEMHQAGVGEAAASLSPGSALHESIRLRLQPGERVAHVSLEQGMFASFCIVTNQRLFKIPKKAAKQVLDLATPIVQPEPLKRVLGTQLHDSGVQIELKKSKPWVIVTKDLVAISSLQALVQKILADPPAKPRGRLFIPLSAAGLALNKDGLVRIEVTDSGIAIHSTAPTDTSQDVEFGELVEISVGGPGLEIETSGGGMMGGGFGLVGFAIGAAAAAAYNHMTTNTEVSMTTILTVIGKSFEAKFFTSEVSPEVLDEEMAPARIGIRQHAQASSTSPPQTDFVEKLQALAALRSQGLLSESDFEVAKQKLLGTA